MACSSIRSAPLLNHVGHRRRETHGHAMIKSDNVFAVAYVIAGTQQECVNLRVRGSETGLIPATSISKNETLRYADSKSSNLNLRRFIGLIWRNPL